MDNGDNAFRLAQRRLESQGPEIFAGPAADTNYGSADRTRRGCRPSTYPTNGG